MSYRPSPFTISFQPSICVSNQLYKALLTRLCEFYTTGIDYLEWLKLNINKQKYLIEEFTLRVSGTREGSFIVVPCGPDSRIPKTMRATALLNSTFQKNVRFEQLNHTDTAFETTFATNYIQVHSCSTMVRCEFWY
jgi:hypothetical protein